MKKVLGIAVGVLGMAYMAMAVSTVASHSTPALVDEINAALANPTNTTITVTGTAAFGVISNATGSLYASNVTVNGSLSGTVVSSNAVGNLFTSNLTANGAATIAGAVSAASVSAAIVSNATGVSYASNTVANGTLAVGGAATVTGSLIAKGDIDADEVDAETATALLLGKATATSVTVGAADAGTTVAGTFAASGAATFSSNVTLTVISTNGAVTMPTINILPDNCATGEAIMLKFIKGSTTYIVPAFALTP